MNKKSVTSCIMITTILLSGFKYNITSTGKATLNSQVIFDYEDLKEIPLVIKDAGNNEPYDRIVNPIDEMDFGLYELENTPDILAKKVDEYNKFNELVTRKRTEEENKKRMIDSKIEEMEINNLLVKSKDYLGIPYVWGGENTRTGLDCSAFVRDLYANIGYRLPRVSKDQAKVGVLVSRTNLKPGDLLFFDTRSYRDSSDIRTPTEEMENALNLEKGFIPNKVSHVGMYIGKGKMIHASSGKGKIVEDNINTNYYKNRFLHARRIIVK